VEQAMVTMSLPVLRALRDSRCAATDVRTSADADEDAFLLRETACHGESVVVADLDALGDLRIPGRVLQVKVGFGTNPAPVP
jgi:hypothetical protein